MMATLGERRPVTDDGLIRRSLAAPVGALPDEM